MNVMQISENNRFTCPFHVTTNQIEDELVALNLETSFYYGVDGIGTQIWRLLIDENLTIAEACAKLREEYDVDAETCLREVRAFVEQLIDAKLLEPVAA
jgi:hypothetical protein